MLKKIITVFFIILLLPTIAFARWQGPKVIVTGTWGKGFDQFGYQRGDSAEYFPQDLSALADGRIVVIDEVNARWILYGQNGEYIKHVKALGIGCYGLSGDKILTLYWDGSYKTGRFGVFDIVREKWIWKDSTKSYPPWDYSVIQSGNDIFIWHNKAGYKYSSQGQMIEALSQKPLAFGIVRSSILQSNGQHRLTVEYDGATYEIKGPPDYNAITRDSIANLYMVTGADDHSKYHVYKYNKHGKLLGSIAVPLDKVIRDDNPKRPDEPITLPRIIAEYGEPVISQSGDVYAWKRSDAGYSILKWSWVDD